MAMTTVTGSIKAFQTGNDVTPTILVGHDATDHYAVDGAGSGKIVIRIGGSNIITIGVDAAAVASLIAALQAL